MLSRSQIAACLSDVRKCIARNANCPRPHPDQKAATGCCRRNLHLLRHHKTCPPARSLCGLSICRTRLLALLESIRQVLTTAPKPQSERNARDNGNTVEGSQVDMALDYPT